MLWFIGLLYKGIHLTNSTQFTVGTSRDSRTLPIIPFWGPWPLLWSGGMSSVGVPYLPTSLLPTNLSNCAYFECVTALVVVVTSRPVKGIFQELLSLICHLPTANSQSALQEMPWVRAVVKGYSCKQHLHSVSWGTNPAWGLEADVIFILTGCHEKILTKNKPGRLSWPLVDVSFHLGSVKVIELDVF